jgi:hypothetical protein
MRTQAAWRGRHPDYFSAHCLHRRQVAADVAGDLDPPRLTAPLSTLPWDLAQDTFGVVGAGFLGQMGRVLLTAAQDQCEA